MNKTVIAGGIVAVAIVVSIAYGAVANPGGNEEKRADSEIWNFRFSGPEFHNINSHKFSAVALEQNVPYKFEFVAMGDSPERLEIQLRFEGRTDYSERFMLERELVDTGISKYYTWEYIGQKYVQIPELEGEIPSSDEPIYEITISRYGNLEGSVSISLTKVDRSI